ncbi:MAG: NAD-dependent epimerase/dehydratase family protein [Phycisphaerales bacterium]
MPTPTLTQALAQFRPRVAGQRALITGGAGFIGSHLAHALDGLGARVVILDDLSGGFRENLPARTELIEASILDEAALRRAAAGCRWAFHQAAMVSVPLSVERPEECVRVNVVGTERVLSAAREAGVGRVMFAASAAASGDTPRLPSPEADPPDPCSPYAMSKVAGELLLRSFSRCYGMSTVSLRYFNIFGARQNPDSPYAAVVSAFLKALRGGGAGRRPTIFGDGMQSRDFTHVDNVVLANLLAATSERPLAGEVVNIGTGVRTSLLELLSQMARALGEDVEPAFGPERAGDVPHSVADISAAEALLGYRPVVGLAEGLEATVR